VCFRRHASSIEAVVALSVGLEYTRIPYFRLSYLIGQLRIRNIEGLGLIHPRGPFLSSLGLTPSRGPFLLMLGLTPPRGPFLSSSGLTPCETHFYQC
jgi:hypothetical protein